MLDSRGQMFELYGELEEIKESNKSSKIMSTHWNMVYYKWILATKNNSLNSIYIMSFGI